MTNALPNDATWTDYLNAHGGPEASGWWVTLGWLADSVHPRPEVVGPYSSYEQAVAAMQDSTTPSLVGPRLDGRDGRAGPSSTASPRTPTATSGSMTCTWPQIRPRSPRCTPTTGTGSR